MILILSQRTEFTTIGVADWISYLGGSFIRINGVDFFKNIKLSISNKETKLEVGMDLDWTKIEVVWSWRWLAFEEQTETYLAQEQHQLDSFKSQINHFLRSEYRTLLEFFLKSIPTKKVFSRIEILELNKLLVLTEAAAAGLEIPTTQILTRPDDLVDAIKDKELITKAMSEAPFIAVANNYYSGYTAVVKESPEFFFAPSLFQIKVEKKYEIRSFLLSDIFYSMAIFSQTDPQTAVDFRIYNRLRPNRTVPFQLPEKIEEKLRVLAKKLQITSGSFDIIKTVDNRYIFLEVNSAGQFGMVSYPCNYYLNKKLARSLLKHNL